MSWHSNTYNQARKGFTDASERPRMRLNVQGGVHVAMMYQNRSKAL